MKFVMQAHGRTAREAADSGWPIEFVAEFAGSVVFGDLTPNFALRRCICSARRNRCSSGETDLGFLRIHADTYPTKSAQPPMTSGPRVIW